MDAVISIENLLELTSCRLYIWWLANVCGVISRLCFVIMNSWLYIQACVRDKKYISVKYLIGKDNSQQNQYVYIETTLWEKTKGGLQ